MIVIKNKAWVSRKDCYSLDFSLSPVIAEALKKFQSELIRLREEDHPMRSVPVLDVSPEEWEAAYQDWIDIVGKMIYAFESDKHEPAYNDSSKPDNTVAWEEYVKEREEHSKKCQEGLDLFAEYYYHLWW